MRCVAAVVVVVASGFALVLEVRRADGSVVEVTLGRALELRELDEELGPGGTPARAEITAELRDRAIAAARPHAGSGNRHRSQRLHRPGRYPARRPGNRPYRESVGRADGRTRGTASGRSAKTSVVTS